MAAVKDFDALPPVCARQRETVQSDGQGPGLGLPISLLEAVADGLRVPKVCLTHPDGDLCTKCSLDSQKRPSQHGS